LKYGELGRASKELFDELGSGSGHWFCSAHFDAAGLGGGKIGRGEGEKEGRGGVDLSGGILKERKRKKRKKRRKKKDVPEFTT